MEEQEEIFSPQHERLSNIASWARIFARVVVFFTIAYAVINVLVIIVQQIQLTPSPNFLGASDSFTNSDFFTLLQKIVGLINGVLKGVVYYLVLKGVSLGLDMIVETDVNYREKEEMEGSNE